MPLPGTRDRSTPSSRASRLTEGPACASEEPEPSNGAKSRRLAAPAVGDAAIADDVPCAGAAAGAGADGADGADGVATTAAAGDADATTALATVSMVATRSPEFIFMPRLRCRATTLPAALEGTSMVALSVSSVAIGVSTSIVSPGAINNSMTATSLKLPRSGTRISIWGTVQPQAFRGLGLSGSMPSVVSTPAR